MSIFKTNKFFRVIKHFILALPLMAILGVSLYTIVNPNAKDSYSGQVVDYEKQFKYETNEVNSNDDLSNGYIYKFNYYSYVTSDYFYNSNSVIGGYFVYANNVIIDYPTIDDFILSDEAYTYIYTSLDGGTISFAVYLSGVSSPYFNAYSDLDLDSINENSFIIFVLDYLEIEENTLYTFFEECPQEYIPLEYVEVEKTTLDNSFTYAMNEFNNIGFGKIDFVGLVNGIFINDASNVYLDFINSYINYYLMIECVYFAPWVLHMFIHMAYELGDYFTSIIKRKKGEDD